MERRTATPSTASSGITTSLAPCWRSHRSLPPLEMMHTSTSLTTVPPGTPGHRGWA
uniref:Uncharacterized protein n=1 Tax=Anguilla anguilla TaxID=7936 RepID=A0A0E9U444_ANGAN